MPTWSDILHEVQQGQNFDVVRRKYLKAYSDHVGRPTILYATAFTQGAPISPQLLSITLEDIQGLMEVTYGMGGGDVDIILHSPGGSIDAAEAIVNYLRARFTNIRVIIPQAAMSAATMISCACDEIFMGKHSSLGPSDPQFILQTALGPRQIAAQSVIAQFERAVKECSDQSRMPAWIPILGTYGPDLLIMCENAVSQSKELVQNWLQKFMFAGESDGPKKAERIANMLVDSGEHKSHGRPLARDFLKACGMKVRDLEADEVMQDLALSVFHATTHTFVFAGAAKIIENQNGRAFMKIQPMQQMMMPPFAPGPAIPEKPEPSSASNDDEQKQEIDDSANRTT